MFESLQGKTAKKIGSNMTKCPFWSQTHKQKSSLIIFPSTHTLKSTKKVQQKFDYRRAERAKHSQLAATERLIKYENTENASVRSEMEKALTIFN